MHNIFPERIIMALFIAVLATACSGPGPVETGDATGLVLPKGWESSAATIIADDLLDDVSRLASDAFEGRGPGSAGDELTHA